MGSTTVVTAEPIMSSVLYSTRRGQPAYVKVILLPDFLRGVYSLRELVPTGTRSGLRSASRSYDRPEGGLQMLVFEN